MTLINRNNILLERTDTHSSVTFLDYGEKVTSSNKWVGSSLSNAWLQNRGYILLRGKNQALESLDVWGSVYIPTLSNINVVKLVETSEYLITLVCTSGETYKVLRPSLSTAQSFLSEISLDIDNYYLLLSF